MRLGRYCFEAALLAFEFSEAFGTGTDGHRVGVTGADLSDWFGFQLVQLGDDLFDPALGIHGGFLLFGAVSGD
jgi:hypothetical protein